MSGPQFILIVDHNPSSSELTAIRLKKMGFTCAIVAQPELVPDFVAQHRPDLILVDVVCQSKAVFELPKIVEPHGSQIVVHSALSEQAVITESLKCGYQDYILRPASNQELHTRLLRLLQLRYDKSVPNAA